MAAAQQAVRFARRMAEADGRGGVLALADRRLGVEQQPPTAVSEQPSYHVIDAGTVIIQMDSNF